MKRSTDPRRNILKREPAKLVTRIGLAVIFLLGALMAYMGIRGQNEFSASGFSSESAYRAIYALSGQVSDAWKNIVQPEMDSGLVLRIRMVWQEHYRHVITRMDLRF